MWDVGRGGRMERRRLGVGGGERKMDWTEEEDRGKGGRGEGQGWRRRKDTEPQRNEFEGKRMNLLKETR